MSALVAFALRTKLRGIPGSAVVVFVILLIALLSGHLTPHSPIQIDLANALRPPWPLHGGSPSHLFGTDDLGRDVLSRTLAGAQTSLAVAATSIAVAGLAGSLVGLVAGYIGGAVDAAAMRATDVMLTFPTILLALVFAVAVGPDFWIVVLVLSLTLWARFARLVRAEALVVRERDFVRYAQVVGSSPLRISVIHLLPNVSSTIVVLATLHVGYAIILEASLSFLGAGVPPPAPTLGGMISAGRVYLESAWWVVAFPAITMVVVILAFNIFGDWVRDALDPKLQQV